MIDFSRYLSKHRTWETVNHQADVDGLNVLLAKHGLKVDGWTDGPTITTYKTVLDVDSKINTLLKLDRNFSVAVNDKNVRVYQDGQYLCVEKRGANNSVLLGDLLTESFFRMSENRPAYMLGKDTTGQNIYSSIDKAPHILISGCTGSGKTMLLHCIILSLLMGSRDSLDFIGIDVKQTEMADYRHLSNFHYISDVQDSVVILKKLCNEMDKRYQILARANCRDISAYHAAGGKMKRKVIVIDELADLMYSTGKAVEKYIVRLAQKARACGIHLILATQYPKADIVTGLIKVNFPTRICMSVTSAIQSRVAIDQPGGEKLNGNGDMLFLGNGSRELVRIQAPLVPDQERQAIIALCMREQKGR